MITPHDMIGPTRAPIAAAQARQLVILLHGVGADGNDLIGLATHWQALLPHAAFVSPNAPFPCDMAPFGFQWFSLLRPSLADAVDGVRAAAPLLNAFIDDALARYRLSERDLALVGFSQGAMMALHVALRRPHACAGVISYSGALIGDRTLDEELSVRPPVLLVHGEADELVPVQATTAAERTLAACGVETEMAICPEIGHSIDSEGLQRGGQFLAQCFATQMA